MNNYKQWTGAQREKSLALFNRCKKLGIIQRPTKCRFCGQTKGILQTHNMDYDVTLRVLPKMLMGTATEEEKKEVDDVLVPICWRCHMILHAEHRNPEAHKRYFEEVKAGKQYPPVYHHDFSILKENGFD